VSSLIGQEIRRLNLQINWQYLSPSDKIEAKIRKHIAKLEKFAERLAVCASNRRSD
jgi:hypothetical protein